MSITKTSCKWIYIEYVWTFDMFFLTKVCTVIKHDLNSFGMFGEPLRLRHCHHTFTWTMVHANAPPSCFTDH